MNIPNVIVDLDKEWGAADELYCEWGYLLCLDRILYSDWCKLVAQYAHYQYIWPDDRCLNETLMDSLFPLYRRSAGGLMTFVLLVRHIEVHFNETEQARLLSMIIQRNPAPPKSPKV